MLEKISKQVTFPKPSEFNPITQKAEADGSKFKGSLIYKASSPTGRAATQRNPVLKKQKTNKHKLTAERSHLLPNWHGKAKLPRQSD